MFSILTGKLIDPQGKLMLNFMKVRYYFVSRGAVLHQVLLILIISNNKTIFYKDASCKTAE